MSADNWTSCPRCVAAWRAKCAIESAAVAAQYGKVSVEAFDAARAALTKLECAVPEHTLREDYEIGIHDGKFDVDYSAGCECGFRFRFTHVLASPGDRQEQP